MIIKSVKLGEVSVIFEMSRELSEIVTNLEEIYEIIPFIYLLKKALISLILWKITTNIYAIVIVLFLNYTTTFYIRGKICHQQSSLHFDYK